MPRSTTLLHSGEILIQTLWIGALWTAGYIAAPVLFAQLDSQDAGRIAGELFSIVAWISVVCGAALFLMQQAIKGRASWLRSGLVLAMTTLVACSEWLVRPAMEATRLADGTPGDGFGKLHAVSAVLYLAASLLAVVLVATTTGRFREE